MTNLLDEEVATEVREINNLLIQVDRSKFRDYISKGIITPDKFLEDDIESNFKDFLLLSTGYINRLDKEELLLEVILTTDEMERLKKLNSNVYILDKPLPITRIKTIYVSNKRVDTKDIQESLKIYNMGYISEKLFESFPKGGKNLIKCYIDDFNGYEISDYSEKLLKYDKLMGLFASIKNSNLYYANRNNIYQNYPDSYFSFYDVDKKSINITQWIMDSFNNLDIEKELIKRLNSLNYIDREFLTEIIAKIENNEIKNRLEILRDNPLDKKEILNFFKEYKEPIYYYISLLFIYGKKGSNSKYAFKENILEEVPYEKAENALALFGLYYGYRGLPAYEEIDIEDKEFKKLSKENEFNIKFKLDSQLDYLLIESIYQYIFNDKREKREVDYLKGIFDKKIKMKPIKLPINQEFKRWYKIENKNKILDIENIKIKKLNWEELISEKLDIRNKIIDAKNKIFAYVYEYHNELIEYDISSSKKHIKLFFDGNKFIELISSESDIRKQNKLLKILD